MGLVILRTILLDSSDRECHHLACQLGQDLSGEKVKGSMLENIFPLMVGIAG